MTNEELRTAIGDLHKARLSGALECSVDGNDWYVESPTQSIVLSPQMNYVYRIKPRPREVWIREAHLDNGGSDRIGDAYRTPDNICKWRKFREVLGDD